MRESQQLKMVDAASPLHISELGESIDYLFLENSEEAMVAQIDKIEEAKGLLVVLDREILETIFVYDDKGHFQFSLETGPGAENEPASIQDFTLDTQNEHIIVLDRDGQKIFYFDFSGRFIKRVDLNFFADFIQVFDNHHLIVFRNIFYEKNDLYNNNQIVFIDTTGKVIQQIVPLEAGQMYPAFYESMNPFSKRNNVIFFHPALSNKVYTINEDGSYSTEELLLGARDLIDHIKNIKTTPEFATHMNKDNMLFSVGLTFYSDQMKVSLFRNNAQYEYATVDKNAGEIVFHQNLDNDFDQYSFLKPVSQSHQSIYFSSPSEMITNIFNNNKALLPASITEHLSEEQLATADFNPIVIRLNVKP